MSLQTLVHHYKYVDLTGEEIYEMTGRQPVIFSDLDKYKNINELLGNHNFAVILLQTSGPNVGHWVSITRDDNGKIRYCDPYGLNPFIEINKYVPYDRTNYPDYFRRLFRGVDFEYNKVDYQSKQKGTSTCGRYACVFVKLRNLTLEQIERVFKGNNNAYLQDTDNVVCLLTMLGLKNIQNYFS